MNANYWRAGVDIAKNQSQRSFWTFFFRCIIDMSAFEGQQTEVRPMSRETYISDLFYIDQVRMIARKLACRSRFMASTLVLDEEYPATFVRVSPECLDTVIPLSKMQSMRSSDVKWSVLSKAYSHCYQPIGVLVRRN